MSCHIRTQLHGAIVCRLGGVNVSGSPFLAPKMFDCIITNDEIGKTLSINDGNVQFTIPFEPIERFLK